MDIEIGGETFHKEANLLEQIAYRDTWGRGADSFIAMLYERLILMRDLLADDGSIYVHMGPKVNHLIRAARDEVFGTTNHLNEIVWKRAFAHSDSQRCGIIHDVILLYAKGDRWLWNEVRQADDPQYIETFFDCFDETRKKRYQRITLGGLLETLLLGRINRESDKTPVFKAKSAPKDKADKTRPLGEWMLKDYIGVTNDLKWITVSAKQVAEVLRDFRNYIHPHKQLSHGVRLSSDDVALFWEVSKNIAVQVLKSCKS